MRKFLVALATAGAVALGAHPAAADTPYLQLSPTTAGVGQRVTAYGSGFCSADCSAVTIAVGNQVVASGVQVGADGKFTAVVTINLTPGTYTVIARQTGAGGSVSSASASLQVAASDTGASPTPGTSPGGPTPPPSAVSTPAGVSPTQQAPIDSNPNALKPGWIVLVVVVVAVLLLYAAGVAFLRGRRKK